MKKRNAILTAAAAALAAGAYCYETLELEDWEVPSKRLPPAFAGTRITLITDLHQKQWGTGGRTLLKAVEKSRPDYIAICGDLVNKNSDQEVPKTMLRGLSKLAPCYFVTGNHERARSDLDRILQDLRDCGIRVLRNEAVTLEREGQKLLLLGVEDPYQNYNMERPQELMARIRREAGDDPFLVVLYHRNNSLELWSELQADVVLAGHGHGGVIRLPGVGGVLGVNRRLFPDDCEGLYTRGRTTLAVSRGAGGMRLWNRPHVPTIVLK